jgi:hypothetical protein
MPALTQNPPVTHSGARISTAAAVCVIFTWTLAACAELGGERTPRGSTHTYRSQLPPDQVARCFARNAEEHSSALASAVTIHDGRATVAVSVKNGTPYANAEFRRAGSGSTGTIHLNVVTSGRQSDLIASLTEGC